MSKTTVDELIEYIREGLRIANSDGLNKGKVTLAITKLLQEYNTKN